MADTVDPCIYYWCENGKFLQWIFPCSYGSAVPYHYFGPIVPCMDNSRSCSGGGKLLTLIRHFVDENLFISSPFRPFGVTYF